MFSSAPIKVGFITPPIWFAPAIAEFPQVVEETIYVQQAPLLLPDFDYQLSSIAAVQDQLNLNATCLARMGCEFIAQLGSPFSWAGVTSEQQARERQQQMSNSSGIPCTMTGLAIVDALRALKVKNLTVNCTYYENDWRDNFAAFLDHCGFNNLHVSTLVQQGLIPENAKMKDYGWSMTDDLTRQSILSVENACPDAEAIVITGAGTRTLSILVEMEHATQKPIIAADTVLYWSIARHLGLNLTESMGTLHQLFFE